jgi:hypothetical protein
MKPQHAPEASQNDAEFVLDADAGSSDPNQAGSLDVLVLLLEQATIRQDSRHEKQASSQA